jgi:hypothetical protein
MAVSLRIVVAKGLVAFFYNHAVAMLHTEIKQVKLRLYE